MDVVLTALSHFVINTISSMGYLGVTLLMGIESSNIPLPSEVIMPFSGFLVFQGRFTLIGIALAGGLGCLLGSWLSYWVGYKGGRPLIERWGRYILISKHDLDLADKWFSKYGVFAAFIGRLLPVIRTFISFPAGISKVNFWKFSAYTFVGSVIWSYFLGWIGYKLGENWESLKGYFHKFDYAIVAIILIGIAYYIYRHIKNSK